MSLGPIQELFVSLGPEPGRRVRLGSLCAACGLPMLLQERTLQRHPWERRAAVARELLQSERRYVQLLAAVRDVYATPLRAALASNRAILSAANIRIIFSDILRILSLNR